MSIEHFKEHWPAYAMFGLALALIGVIIWLMFAQQAYNVEHHCEPTGDTRGHYDFVSVYNGKDTTIVPVWQEEHLWSCDNGNIWE